LRAGLTLSGIHYGAIEATIERVQGANLWLTFAIREGKNREVRNVLGHLGLDVTRLIRVSFGPFQLAELKAGDVEEVRTRILREQLGERLVADSGVDFSMPLLPRSPTPDKDPRRETTPRKPPSHSWRAHEEERPGKKFQRKFHGARRNDETPPQRPADDVRAEVLTDRKGRPVPVERHGQPPPREPPQKQPEKPSRYGRRRSSPDRASGPRPRQPRSR
jgi:23S rRNA pseudouridine2605 synthase